MGFLRNLDPTMDPNIPQQKLLTLEENGDSSTLPAAPYVEWQSEACSSNNTIQLQFNHL